MKPVVVAITGASGAVYGQRLLTTLVDAQVPVELVMSSAGERVLAEEMGLASDARSLQQRFGDGVTCHPRDNIGARIASGSFPVTGMVICPCSMGTAARVAAGVSANLIERAADVQLKERRPLVMVVRETPFSTLHLENLTRLSRSGATVMPAAPGFYQRPTQIDQLVDFVVERAIAALGIDTERSVAWTGTAP